MAVSIFCSALYTTDTSQMAEYTLNELRDMHLLYGETCGNSRAARLLYAERFPMRRLPSHVLFQRIDARICETGHEGPTRRGAGRPRNVRRNMSQWTTANGNCHVSTLEVCCGTRMDSKRKRSYSTYRSKSSLTPWWLFQLVADTAAQKELIGVCCDGSQAVYP